MKKMIIAFMLGLASNLAYAGPLPILIDFTAINNFNRRPVPPRLLTDALIYGTATATAQSQVRAVEISPDNKVTVIFKRTPGRESVEESQLTYFVQYASLEAYNLAVQGDRRFVLPAETLKVLRRNGRTIALSGISASMREMLTQMPGFLPLNADTNSLNLKSAELLRNGSVLLTVTGRIVVGVSPVESFEKTVNIPLASLNRRRREGSPILRPSDFLIRSHLSFWRKGGFGVNGFSLKTPDERNSDAELRSLFCPGHLM